MGYRLLILFVALGFYGRGQQIETIIKSKPFEFAGSASLSGYMNQNSHTATEDLYGYALSFRPVISIYGFKLPFSFTYRDNNFNYTKPGIRLGISPSYKWVKVHLGVRSMYFSDYTLSGHEFIGGGVELYPGKFRFSAMYGNLRNYRSLQDSVFTGVELPAFKRRAYGAKIGMQKGRNYFDVTYFKAGDDPTSIQIPDSLLRFISPQENAVLGLNGGLSMGVFSLEIKTAASAFTRNQNSSNFEIDERLMFLTQTIIQPNNSTRLSLAGEAKVSLNFNRWTLGGNYRRIEPYFQSLGAYYMNNDIESITGSLSFNVFKGAFSFQGSYGIEKDNLNRLKTYRNIRNVATMNLNVRPFKPLNISAYYSDQTNSEEPGVLAIDDTLRYGQQSSMLNISPSLHFKRQKMSHTISMAYNAFDFNEITFDTLRGAKTTTEGYNLNYSIRWKESGTGLRMGGNYTELGSPLGEGTTRYGGTLGWTQRFLDKKMNANISATYNLRTRGQENGNVIIGRMSLAYKIGKKQGLNASVNYTHRTSNVREDYNTFRASIGYNISF